MTAATSDSTTMRAIYTTTYGPPDQVLSLQNVEKPTPASNEVLIRVVSASCHAGDWHLIRGTPCFIRLMFGGINKPTINIPGCDLAGVIEAVGIDATEFKVGDEVFGDLSESHFGAFAEYVTASVDSIVKKPDNVSFQQAAACGTSCQAALQALRDLGELKPGEKVLVNGATGGVGSFAVQIAKSFGAEVTAVGHKDKLDMLRDIGADHVVDYTTTDITTQADRKYDVVLDAAAFKSPTEYLSIMNPKGRYVMAGGSTSNFLRMIYLAPWICATRSQKAMPLAMKVEKKDLLVIQEMLASGTLKPYIDRTYGLADVPQAITHIEQRKVRGKVVINI